MNGEDPHLPLKPRDGEERSPDTSSIERFTRPSISISDVRQPAPLCPPSRTEASADQCFLTSAYTWYLTTNLPRPHGSAAAGSPHPPADLAQVVRLYGLRGWIEQGYKQVKDELGWADFQVRSSVAIRRHQMLVMAAFCFCWHTWLAGSGPPDGTADPGDEPPPSPGANHANGGQIAEGRGKKQLRQPAPAVLAVSAAPRARLAHPLDTAPALLAFLVQRAPAP
ncbi:hypothetical protein AB0J63_42765 [Streptosporangium canum]|uniref:hypothetical protein n=1 Tax=Streptosporangium canum TaxID=324952 RepID=UPI00344176BF